MQQKEFRFLDECASIAKTDDSPCRVCGGGEQCFACKRWQAFADAFQMKFVF